MTTDDEVIEACAKVLAEQQGMEWDSLPGTDAEAEKLRSPDCCNRLDCKSDVREAVIAVLTAQRTLMRLTPTQE